MYRDILTMTETRVSPLECLVLKGIVGSIGARKDEVHANFNRLFGEDSWQIVHHTNRLIPQQEMFTLWDESYEKLLSERSDAREVLSRYADVYDIDPSDVQSKTNYSAQKNPRGKHMQDIAIRRAMQKLEIPFQGTELLQVRSNDPIGAQFSPGFVEFIHPDLIPTTSKKDWYDPKSVEAFYQQTKALLVQPSNLQVKLNGFDEEGFFVNQGDIEYFVGFDNPFVLRANARRTSPRRKVIGDFEHTFFEAAQTALRLRALPITKQTVNQPVYAEAFSELNNEPIELKYNATAVAQKDPLALGKIHHPVGRGVHITTQGTYIGLAGEMLHQAIAETGHKYHEQQVPGHESYSRQLIFDQGTISEAADFNRGRAGYHMSVRGIIPGEVFGRILFTNSLLRKLTDESWQITHQKKKSFEQRAFTTTSPDQTFSLSYHLNTDGSQSIAFSANILGKLYNRMLTQPVKYDVK